MSKSILCVSRRLKIVRRLLLSVVTMAVAALVFCVSYLIKQPCPAVEPTRTITSIAIWAAYRDQSPFAIEPGAWRSRVLCRMDNWLIPGYTAGRGIYFLGAIPNREKHETYYVFAPSGSADWYVAYIVRDGEVMPCAKFDLGGA